MYAKLKGTTQIIVANMPHQDRECLAAKRIIHISIAITMDCLLKKSSTCVKNVPSVTAGNMIVEIKNATKTWQIYRTSFLK